MERPPPAMCSNTSLIGPMATTSFQWGGNLRNAHASSGCSVMVHHVRSSLKTWPPLDQTTPQKPFHARNCSCALVQDSIHQSGCTYLPQNASVQNSRIVTQTWQFQLPSTHLSFLRLETPCYDALPDPKSQSRDYFLPLSCGSAVRTFLHPSRRLASRRSGHHSSLWKRTVTAFSIVTPRNGGEGAEASREGAFDCELRLKTRFAMKA